MLSHVLVPLDGSALAEEALEHARALVGAEGRITLIAAVEVDETPAYGPALMPFARVSKPDYRRAMDDLLPLAVGYLHSVAERLGSHVACQALVGEPAAVVCDLACALGVDAIVMSTHGRSGLGRWIFGSVTAKVLHHSACPVYVVPSGRRHRPAS